MAVRKQAGLWLVVGVVACVAGWGLRENLAGTEAGATSNAQAVASQSPVLRLQGDLSTVGKQAPLTLTAAMARRALRDGVLQVDLPDGTTYPVRMERQETDRFGQWSVIGRVKTPVSDQAMVLTFGGEAVFGTLPMPDGRAMQIVTNRGAVQASLAGGLVPDGRSPASDIARRSLAEVRTARTKAMFARAGHAPTAAASHAEHVRATIAPAPAPVAGLVATQAEPTGPYTITVLAVYADDLVALRGSVAAVQTELSNKIAAANQAHIDSGTRVRLSLVATRKIAIPATMENDDALYEMTSAPVGDVDLEVLRDQYSADLVTLVRPYNAYVNCGIAWVAGAGGWGQSASNLFGYSVVNAEPCGPHVTAHEIGHNLGSAHDRETDFSDGEIHQGAYPFSFGYRRKVAPAFATIMAYAEDEPWLGRFSDPTASACGAPCGVADQADNVRSINLMAKTVSEFRTAPGVATISDADMWETDPGTGYNRVMVPIRINGFAGANGKRFHVDIVGGTAKLYEDYSQYVDSVYDVTLTDWDSEGLFVIGALGDTVVEGDETIVLKLTSLDNYPIADDTAVITIRNDDPRPHIRGTLQLDDDPSSMMQPFFSGRIDGLNGGRDDGMDITLRDPPYAFDFAVAPGANIQFSAKQTGTIEGTPYAVLPQLFNDVRKDRYVTVPAPHAVPVVGTVLGPPGSAYFELSQMIRARESYGNLLLNEEDFYVGDAYQTKYSFKRWVYPGATLELYADMTYSNWYSSWLGIRQDIRQGTTMNIQLSSSPTLIVHSVGKVPEGRAGRNTLVPIVVESLAGPPGPARWHTVDGTAKAGTDYVAASGTVMLTTGGTYATAWVEIIGDNVPEREKYFDVVLEPVTGYNLTVPSTRVTVTNDDSYTGGPQQRTQKAP